MSAVGERKKEKKSSAIISNQIAQSATLAATVQAVTEVRPGNISRYHNFNNSKIENYLRYAVTLNQPIIDLATRGIMVERSFIDMDEVDIGWILSSAIRSNTPKQGYDHHIGMLLAFSPIAASAGYLISEDENQLNLDNLKRLSIEFLDNTTPEDADNLFSALYDLESPRYSFINDFSETKIEGTNYMLEEEINLSDLYGLFKKNSIIFSEMHNEYGYCFDQGMKAFDEAIVAKASFTDAITHTFIHVLGHNAPKLKNRPPHLAYKLKQEALNLIDIGGYLTAKGKIMTSKFDNTILNYDNPIELNEIAELTATISFISLLRGDDLFK